jgi:RNA polymerase sigma-70 factor (ECF subfamily)
MTSPRSKENRPQTAAAPGETERYRTLLEINNASIANLTQDALFRAIAEAVRRVVPFDRTAVFLHDPGRDVLRLFTLESSLPTSYFVLGLEMPANDSHVGRVFREQRLFLRGDLDTQREFPMEERAYGDGVRSYVIVPLVVHGRNIGTLAVASVNPHQYSESDAAFFQEVASSLGMDVISENALVDRLRRGDTVALEALMERHASRAFRVARDITRTDADAEEVVQDVFLTIARKIDRFEGRAALSTWIYRVTTNAALIKRRGKRAQLEVSLEEHLPSFKEDGHRDGERSYLLADWSQNPEAELLDGEARAVLSRAIEGLPETYRAVLVLRDVEERSNEETAEILGESVASIKSRAHRARMALREQLTRDWAVPRP